MAGTKVCFGGSMAFNTNSSHKHEWANGARAIFIVAMCYCGCGHPPECYPPNPEDLIAPTSAQREGLQRFFAALGHKLPTESSVSIRRRGSPSLALPEASIYWEPTSLPVLRGSAIKARESDGMVTAFITGDPFHGPPGFAAEVDEDVPEATAWAAAEPVLRYYGLSTSRVEYELKLEDLSTGRSWRVSTQDNTHDPSNMANVEITVSATTGKVIAVRYGPILQNSQK
ncbi:MAG: hypothetical protein HUU46_14055 [Candidatus Hydrogenedentes bacterium]|nr:hypothetical protein [Candidatus Hydrogenedentota bacterium]